MKLGEGYSGLHLRKYGRFSTLAVSNPLAAIWDAILENSHMALSLDFRFDSITFFCLGNMQVAVGILCK
jgi:hypothetical protein